MAKVSIIIPYLKGQAYLEDCVQTLASQGLSEYEIIVVNDKDGEPVPDSVKEKAYVTVYNAVDELPPKQQEHEPDEAEPADEYEEKSYKASPYGVASCRNLGIKKATGKYVYFIDCDDYVLENALPLLLELAEEKQAQITTGNKYSSWFKPANFSLEKARKETQIQGIQRVEGEILKQRFRVMFSAQHLLINRDFLLENEIVFDEGNTYYSDARFVVQALKLAGDSVWINGDSIYVWRHRNDSIHYPALCQKKRPKKGREYLEAYRSAMEFVEPQDTALRECLERQLLHFCRDKFPARIKGAIARGYTKELQKIPDWKEQMSGFSFLQRLELGLVRKGKYRMTKPVIGFARWKRKKKGIFGSRLQWYRALEKKIFKKMSLRKDWVLIESFFGKSYSDSPKYLYEYLQKTRGDKYRYIWVLNQKSDTLAKTGKHTRVKRNSLRYVYYASRCGYRIFNVRQPAWNKKRSGVVFLETWHGTPLKKLVFDLDDIQAASQDHKMVFYDQSRDWDYMVSANRFSTDVFERAFILDREKILEYGYPRNDILYADNKDEIALEVKRELGIPEDKRVILYAPTWRDNQFYGKGRYKFELAMDLDLMRKELSEDSVILLRTHYHIADILDLSEYEGFVYNGSQYEDVSRLYLASDICITDYSSVFFDFANLKRPMLFFVYDLDSYADEIRGIYFDMEKELPGPLLHTNEELVEALKNMDEINTKYSERYEQFYERFCSVDDGHASERIIEKVFGEREKLL